MIMYVSREKEERWNKLTNKLSHFVTGSLDYKWFECLSELCSKNVFMAFLS